MAGRSFTRLNAGANIGIFPLALAHLSHSGRIIAFEPSPATFRFLSKNVSNHSGTNFFLMPLAVAEHEGELLFHNVPFFEAGSSIVPDGSPLTTEKDFCSLLHGDLTKGCVDNLSGAWHYVVGEKGGRT